MKHAWRRFRQDTAAFLSWLAHDPKGIAARVVLCSVYAVVPHEENNLFKKAVTSTLLVVWAILTFRWAFAETSQGWVQIYVWITAFTMLVVGAEMGLQWTDLPELSVSLEQDDDE